MGCNCGKKTKNNENKDNQTESDALEKRKILLKDKLEKRKALLKDKLEKIKIFL